MVLKIVLPWVLIPPLPRTWALVWQTTDVTGIDVDGATTEWLTDCPPVSPPLRLLAATTAAAVPMGKMTGNMPLILLDFRN